MSISEALVVCLTGFLFTFVILGAIALLIKLTSKILGGISKSKKAEAEPVKESEPVHQEPVQDSSEEDLVIIAAAIAAYLGTTPDQLIVREVRREPSDGWLNSARLQNVSR